MRSPNCREPRTAFMSPVASHSVRFIHPLTILSGLPSGAGVAALLTLLLFGMELNIYGFVGIIMLVRIVKKNAIMMIDFAPGGARAPSTRGACSGSGPS